MWPEPRAIVQGDEKLYHPSGDCVVVPSLWCDQTKMCMSSRSSPSHLISHPSSYTSCWMNVFSLLVSIGSWNLFAGGSLSSHSPLKDAYACSSISYAFKRSEAMSLGAVFAVEMLTRYCFSANGLTQSLMRPTTVDVVSTVVGLIKDWVNPFAEKLYLISISTAKTAPRDIASDLLKAYICGSLAAVALCVKHLIYCPVPCILTLPEMHCGTRMLCSTVLWLLFPGWTELYLQVSACHYSLWH